MHSGWMPNAINVDNAQAKINILKYNMSLSYFSAHGLWLAMYMVVYILFYPFHYCLGHPSPNYYKCLQIISIHYKCHFVSMYNYLYMTIIILRSCLISSHHCTKYNVFRNVVETCRFALVFNISCYFLFLFQHRNVLLNARVLLCLWHV
jgi:hypothetical protein